MIILPLMLSGAGLCLIIAIINDIRDYYRKPAPHPSLRSQRSQIRPLSPAAVALGEKAYLGPMTAKRREKLRAAKRNKS